MIAEASEWRIRGDGWAVRVWKDEDAEPDYHWRASMSFDGVGQSSESILRFASTPGAALAKLREDMESIGARLSIALIEEWKLPDTLSKSTIDFSEFEKR